MILISCDKSMFVILQLISSEECVNMKLKETKLLQVFVFTPLVYKALFYISSTICCSVDTY